MIFKRGSTKNRKEVGKAYRRPVGKHNKQRKFQCKGPMPNPGYGTPKTKRNKHQGHPIIRAASLKDLENAKVCILAKMGGKRKKILLEEAKKRNIIILNHDIDKTLEKIAKERVKEKPKAKKEVKKAEPKKEEKDIKQKKEHKLKKAEKLITKPQ